MAEKKSFEITIPTDVDGFILLQCANCGELFMIAAADCNDDEILDLYCPACGLISDSYVTEDVLNLAMTMEKNYMLDAIYEEVRKLERSMKNDCVKIKAGKKPRYEEEYPLRTGIEVMEIASYKCCNKEAKIKPLLKFIGSYCPFCGVINYETE